QVDESQTFDAKPLDAFVLVSVGDSIASGEGSPNVVAGESPDGRAQWNDGEGPDSLEGLETSKCHQSNYAYGYKVLAWLKRDNPETFCRSVHTACSGVDTQAVANQIETLNTILPTKEAIDALLMTAGANDKVTDGVHDYKNDLKDLATACLSEAACDT